MIAWLSGWLGGGTPQVEVAKPRDAARLAELHGASFHRGWREGKLTRVQFDSVVSQFNHHDLLGNWKWLPLDGAIIRAASELFATLSQEIFLRSSDCMHLATALHHGFDEIHTFDKHQAVAAAALGLRIRKA